jgi:hypothetical protein
MLFINNIFLKMSKSRTRTPSIRNFFRDEDYFEYTRVKSKSINSIKDSYSPSSPSRTKTVSPKLGFLYGDEDDF